MSDAPEKESPPTTPAQPPDRPFQFTIGHMMILTAAVAGFLALATQTHIFVAATYAWVVLLLIAYWMSKKGLNQLALFMFFASNIFWTLFLLIAELG